jgi:hypothetical protein
VEPPLVSVGLPRDARLGWPQPSTPGYGDGLNRA